MNFDFLKDLRGLGHIYKDCSDAENLAMTMPAQSMFTSRKAGELLAKFVYMAAHNERVESMSFMDILEDPVSSSNSCIRMRDTDHKKTSGTPLLRGLFRAAREGNAEQGSLSPALHDTMVRTKSVREIPLRMCV